MKQYKVSRLTCGGTCFSKELNALLVLVAEFDISMNTIEDCS